MKKKYLRIFILLFKQARLNLAEGRVRDRFVRQLIKNVHEYQKEIDQVVEKLADRNEDGTLKVENDNYIFTKNQKEADEELSILANEEVTIDLPPKDKKTLKQALNQLTYGFGEIEIVEEFFKENE